MIIIIRRMGGRIVSRVRLEIRTKKGRRGIGIAIGVMRVIMIRIYMTLRG